MNGFFSGLSTFDLEFVIEDFPTENAKIRASQFLSMSGGPALNAAVTFSSLGGTATLRTKVGTGPFADAVRRELIHFGVKLSDAAEGDSEALPLATILLNKKNGSRTNFYAELSQNKVARAFDYSSLPPTNIVLLDGYFEDEAVLAAEWAKKNAVPVVLDGDIWSPSTPRLLRLVDIAIVSEQFLSQSNGEFGSIQETLHEIGLRQFAVTRGAKSILWYEDSRSGEILPPKIDVVDTLGAGDIFHGAFCYFHTLGKSFVDALTLSSQVASRACESYGTRSWLNA